MCTSSDHIAKYKSNLELLKFLSCSKFPDWQVTVSFYAGLHRLNAYLHVEYDATEADIGGHERVKRYMDKKGLNSIESTFLGLQGLSHTARYSFSDMTTRVEVAEQYLHTLEKKCTIIEKT